tara:strand:+ start:20480 stop:21199 length:720 start_codon:yes stop_codon:yes gene_type:complete
MTESSETSKTITPTAKQVVFLFMAATAVAVVVFLFGVVVGRGGPETAGAGQPDSYPGFQGELLPPVIETRNGAPSAIAVAEDQLTYPQRLQSSAPVEEALPGELQTSDIESPVGSDVDGAQSFARDSLRNFSQKESVDNIVEGRTAAEDGDIGDAAGITTVSGAAYTVQVAALRSPKAAEQVAGHLIAKGFPAYVLEPSPGAPVSVYRVRVGQYVAHQEAEHIRQRLEREEDFKPWITQ